MKEVIKSGVSPFLLAIIFLIPLQNIYLGKIPSFGGGVNILNILMVFALIWACSITDTNFTNTLNKYIFAMIVFYIIAWARAGNYIGAYDPNSLNELKDIFFGYLMFFVVFKICKTLPQLKRVFLATLLPLPYMFKVYYTNLSWMGFSHYSDKLRLNGGTFMGLGSNEINAFYSTYTFVLLAVAITRTNRWKKYSFLVLASMNIYCVIYGFSRGAYIAGIVGLVVFAYLTSKMKLLIGSLLLLITISVIGAQILPKATVERFDMSFTNEENMDTSAKARIDNWDLAMKLFYNNPILGIGYGNFKKVNPSGLDTHNYYIKILVENGVFGFIALLLFFKACWRKIFELRSIATDPFLKAVAIGMIPCIISLMIGNLFGDRFTYYPLISYFYVYMAIVLRGIDLSKMYKEKFKSMQVTYG